MQWRARTIHPDAEHATERTIVVTENPPQGNAFLVPVRRTGREAMVKVHVADERLAMPQGMIGTRLQGRYRSV